MKTHLLIALALTAPVALLARADSSSVAGATAEQATTAKLVYGLLSNSRYAYRPGALDDAMHHSEYDLQALVYTLALHRWLRFRLGDGYDYERDFGGHRYVFSRGIDLEAPAQGAPAGVHARRFDPALIHALDALFAGGQA